MIASALCCLAFSLSRAQTLKPALISGPFIYGATYIDRTGTTSDFTLTYVTSYDNGALGNFGAAQYLEPFAMDTQFSKIGPTYDVLNRWTALTDCTYTLTSGGPATWVANAAPEMSYIGHTGLIQINSSASTVAIDLGLGQGTNFLYTTANGLDFTGSGGFTINGEQWTASGTLHLSGIASGQGALEFHHIVPEPSALALLLGGIPLIRLRSRRG